MPVILALLLLVLAGPARAMTSDEFNQYWIGGGLNAAGRCSTIVHPRVLTTAADLMNARDWADDAGTFNAAGKAQLETMWNAKHTLPPTAGNRAYYSGVIANVYLDANKIGVPQYAVECSTYVGYLFDQNVECNWNTACAPNQDRVIEGGNYALGLYSVTANIYDLTYNEQNGSRRRHAIKKLSKAICASKDEDSGGARWQWTNYKAIPLLAIYGDSADAAFNAVVRDTLLSVINYWERRACPCMDSLDNIGYAENYFSQRQPVRTWLVAAMKRCFPGYDSPLYHTEAITEGATFIRMMCRTDALTPQGANQLLAMARGPDKFNTKGWVPAAMLSLQDALFDDKDAWIVANNLGLNNLCWGPTTQTIGPASSWPVLFWFNPHKYTDAIALSDIQSKYEWSPKWGIFGCRSAWNAVGASNTDYQTFYYPFYIQGSGHLNAGHWQMNRGADGLFINSGQYANADLEDQYQTWLAQSISKNTIGIWQSGETTFDGSSTYYAGDKGAASGCPALPTDPYLASGYQIKGNATEGQALFGGACNNLLATKGQLYTRGTHVQDALVQGQAYYIASDLSKAYNAAKQDFTRRAFYTDGAGVAIILDQVQVGPNVRMVTSAYHTVGPAISSQNYAPFNQTGAITALRLHGVLAPTATDSIRVDSNGGLFGDSRGGGYRIDGNTLNETSAAAVKNICGNSAGWMFPLEVRNVSTNSNGYLLCIGGPGKGGVHWRTNKYPCVTNLYSANRWDEGREHWVWDADSVGTGWNAAPSSHATGSCTALTCAGGVTRFRLSANVTDWSGNVSIRNNDVGATGSGHGKDTGDWSTYTVVPNPGDSDLCESFVVCIGTSSSASKPTVRYTHTGEIVAVAVDQGAGYTVHVVPTATFGPRATTITWDNPLTSENATYKAVGAEPGFVFDLQDQTGAVIDTLTADSEGYLTWAENHDGVTTFTLGPHDPGIPSGPTIVSCNPTVLGPPRLRHVLQAGGGTLLALTAQQSGLGYVIQATISRDDGQTWRDLDGVQGSVTQLWPDEEAVGPNIFAPRADKGFGAALDPTTNDLTIICPTERYNASYVLQATVPRVMRWLWTGTTWDYAAADYSQTTGAEGGATLHPRDCTVLISRAHQAFFSWVGPSGASWAVHSSRLKASTQASMSSGAALFSSQQTPQLMEWPTGTIWQVTMVQPNSGVNDSIRVRTATDGGSAQWGATSRIAGTQQVAAGDFSATVGPSGPTCVVLSGSPIAATLRYWTGSAWATTTSDLGLSVVATASDPLLLTAGVTRVYLATHYLPSGLGGVLSTWWSLSDGWAGWRSDWAGEDVATVHGVMLRPTEGLLFACASALDGVPGTASLDTQRFSLPPEVEPTGACCAGACSVLTYAECVDLGGAWQGPDVPCSPDPCISPPEVGACCYPDGSCVVTAETGCGGVYQGDRTECSPNPCPSGPPSLAGRRRKVILAARGE